MNIALWIIQILLAAVFLTSGSIKLVLPKNKLEKVFDWMDDFSQNRLQIIASFEIIGGLGLFLPGVYPISNLIIPMAAIGLTTIMILAAVVHYNRDEKGEMIIAIVIAVLLIFVSVGRLTI